MKKIAKQEPKQVIENAQDSAQDNTKKPVIENAQDNAQDNAQATAQAQELALLMQELAKIDVSSYNPIKHLVKQKEAIQNTEKLKLSSEIDDRSSEIQLDILMFGKALASDEQRKKLSRSFVKNPVFSKGSSDYESAFKLIDWSLPKTAQTSKIDQDKLEVLFDAKVDSVDFEASMTYSFNPYNDKKERISYNSPELALFVRLQAQLYLVSKQIAFNVGSSTQFHFVATTINTYAKIMSASTLDKTTYMLKVASAITDKIERAYTLKAIQELPASCKFFDLPIAISMSRDTILSILSQLEAQAQKEHDEKNESK